MKLLLSVLLVFGLCANAFGQATVIFAMTNQFGQADTNAITITPVASYVNADGSVQTKGYPFRMYPNASGIAQTNLLTGSYLASNQFLVATFGVPGSVGSTKGVVFQVPNSTGTYYFGNLAISGYNTFVPYGNSLTNNYANVITVLGFTPISGAATTNLVSSNTVALTNFTVGISNVLAAQNVATSNQFVNFTTTNAFTTGTNSSALFTTNQVALYSNLWLTQFGLSSNSIVTNETAYRGSSSNSVTTNLTVNLNVSSNYLQTNLTALIGGSTNGVYQQATNTAGAIALNVSAAATNALASAIYGITNKFYPNNNPSNYTSLTGVTNIVNNIANTNIYAAGNNITFSLSGGTTTIAATGSGAATNAINIINGAGSGTVITNGTFYGSVAITNLDARYDATNTASGMTNAVVQSATNLAGLNLAAVLVGSTNNAIATATNLAGLNLAQVLIGTTNRTLQTATNSFDPTNSANLASNGVMANLVLTNTAILAQIKSATNTSLLMSSNFTMQVSNGVFTTSLSTAQNYYQNGLLGNDSVVLGRVYVGNMAVFTSQPLQTNVIGTGGSIEGNDGTWIWNGTTAWTNTQTTVWSIILSSGSLFKQSNSVSFDSIPFTTLTSLSGTNIAMTAVPPGATPAPNIWFGVTNNGNGQIFAGNPVFTGNPTFVNPLPGSTTINFQTTTNISSNQVYQATNGFGNIVGQSLPALTNTFATTNFVQGLTNTIIGGATNASKLLWRADILASNNVVMAYVTNSPVFETTNSFIGGMPLAQTTPTNILHTYGGQYDGNGLWILSANSTWTNTVNPLYTANLTGGGTLTINSNSVQLYTLTYANFPTNFSLGTFGAGTPPTASYGMTNYLGLITDNPLFNGITSFKDARGNFTGSGMFSNITMTGTILATNAGIAMFANPDGSSRATNYGTVGNMSMDTNFNFTSTGTNTSTAFVGAGTGITNAQAGSFNWAGLTNITNTILNVAVPSRGVFFVSPTGSDSNSGTNRAFPLASYAKASALATNPGNWIDFMAPTNWNYSTTTNINFSNQVNLYFEPGAVVALSNVYGAASGAMFNPGDGSTIYNASFLCLSPTNIGPFIAIGYGGKSGYKGIDSMAINSRHWAGTTTMFGSGSGPTGIMPHGPHYEGNVSAMPVNDWFDDLEIQGADNTGLTIKSMNGQCTVRIDKGSMLVTNQFLSSNGSNPERCFDFAPLNGDFLSLNNFNIVWSDIGRGFGFCFATAGASTNTALLGRNIKVTSIITNSADSFDVGIGGANYTDFDSSVRRADGTQLTESNAPSVSSLRVFNANVQGSTWLGKAQEYWTNNTPTASYPIHSRIYVDTSAGASHLYVSTNATVAPILAW
jgi:hypothetical protein